MRERADEARIVFTAAKGKKPVTTLRQEDVRVVDNNVAQKTFSLRPDPNLPLSLAVLVDASASQKKVMPQERAAVAAFLSSAIRADRDNASIISFSNEARLEQNLTSDARQASAAVERVRVVNPQRGEGTRNSNARSSRNAARTSNSNEPPSAIWDALWYACDQVLESSPSGARRAIILLTDGEDSGSRKKMAEVIERALRSDVAVYSVGVGDADAVRRNQETLHNLSEATGGLSFFPKNEDELRDALSQIQQTLRSQFVVTYSPSDSSADDSFHNVRIELISPELRKQRVRVVHRRGYYAGGAAYPSQNK